jgi:membrane carboxypeptidase/penicillin-binding protein
MWGSTRWAFLRAARVNLDAGEIVEGGSTITQQLVKLRLVGRERTMERKLREAFAALWLDSRMDKDAILTEYLNRIYLGAGAYGVSAAASVYFGPHPHGIGMALSSTAKSRKRSSRSYLQVALARFRQAASGNIAGICLPTRTCAKYIV